MTRRFLSILTGLLGIVLALPATSAGKQIVLRELAYYTNLLRKVPARSYADCQRICGRTAQCASFTFQGRSCSLHRARARLRRTRGALSGLRPATQCARDADCSDGKFCNGAEICRPGVRGANRRGCIAGKPPCAAGKTCNERTRQCTIACTNPDADGDGHKSIACGGDDCDDNDAGRYPGNQEICDATGHDEDCDPCTVAGPRDGDRDGDGHISTNCFNKGYCRSAGVKRATDCDDGNPAIVPGSQVCGSTPTEVKVCGAGPRSSGRQIRSGPWFIYACPGTQARPGHCVAQPNGTGVCVQ